MLLTGLAQQQLRVGGVVEPLLRQCEHQLGEAEADDVARIIIALGELLMEIGEHEWGMVSVGSVSKGYLPCMVRCLKL